MTDPHQTYREDLALVEECIPGCREKLSRAEADLVAAKRKGDKERLRAFEVAVEGAKLQLEENLRRRDELKAKLKP